MNVDDASKSTALLLIEIGTKPGINPGVLQIKTLLVKY